LRFKGRENANKQIGFELMDKVLAASGGEWDTKPAINSNRMIGVLMRKE
jgi:translation initiation factor IF-3